MKSRIVILCFATTCFGQPSRPGFEVATVKVVDTSSFGDDVQVNLGTIQNDRISFGNATLADCVRFAWGIASDAQISAPDWAESRQYVYNIVGKAAVGTSRDEILAMMRTLLEDRFQLKTHQEQREMAHYALVVAKNGPKIRAVPVYPVNYQGKNRPGDLDTILPMSALTCLLSRFETERPVIDATGLKGFYQVKLQWAWTPPQGRAPDDAGQLGLKLESRKGPVEVLVIDNAGKSPADN